MVGQPRRNFIKLISWSKVSEHLVNLIRMRDQPKQNNQILNLVVITMREKHLGDHSIKIAKESDFRGMQFNAIAESNKSALHTYKSLGFKEVGMIPQGVRLKDGSYSNMYIVLYLSLL
ncbi:MAG: hypothetical protein U0O31_05040 [Catenibacterium sp.]|uniref:GNAT family N-acetyltransferase n=1 Tax=Catenibacterium sp. TaxID=2049022 RepID=UPI002F94E0FA